MYNLTDLYKQCYDCGLIKSDSKKHTFKIVTKHFIGRCMIDKCKRSIPHEHDLCKSCLNNEREKEKVNIYNFLFNNELI